MLPEALVVMIAITSSLTKPSPFLCRSEEAKTYTCRVRGAKIMSVCGQGADAVYRFGRPGHVKVEVHNPTRGYQMFSGGGETQVTFRAAGTTYMVYQKGVRTGFDKDGHNSTRFFDGILVRRGDRKLADIECVGIEGGNLTVGTDGAPEAPYVEH